jgi:hypothetical protein
MCPLSTQLSLKWVPRHFVDLQFCQKLKQIEFYISLFIIYSIIIKQCARPFRTIDILPKY